MDCRFFVTCCIFATGELTGASVCPTVARNSAQTGGVDEER